MPTFNNFYLCAISIPYVSHDDLNYFMQNNFDTLPYKSFQEIFSLVLQYGTVLQVSTMLNNGMNANDPMPDFGFTGYDDILPINLAVRRNHKGINDTLKIIEMLVDAGAKIKSSDKFYDGLMPLEYVMFDNFGDDFNWTGKVKIIDLLIKKGVDVNEPIIINTIRSTYLALAIRSVRYKIVEALIKNGANVNAELFNERNDKQTLLDIAVITKRMGAYISEDHKKTIDLLVSKGAVCKYITDFNPEPTTSNYKPRPN